MTSERRMQCKDIPDRPILEFLDGRTEWASSFSVETAPESSIQRAMPPGVPFKVVIAKMARLIARGLVGGCGCGCRGDYSITDAGRRFLRGNP